MEMIETFYSRISTEVLHVETEESEISKYAAATRAIIRDHEDPRAHLQELLRIYADGEEIDAEALVEILLAEIGGGK